MKYQYQMTLNIIHGILCLLKAISFILKDYCMSSGGEKYHKEAIDILKRSIGEKYII